MTAARKNFYQALAVFLVVVGGGFLFLHGQPRAPLLHKTGSQADLPPPPGEEARFKTTISFTPSMSPAKGAAWTSGTVGGGKAWLDMHTGLVWGPKLASPTFPTLQDTQVATAKKACAAQAPAGAWALPFASELDRADSDGLRDADPAAKNHWFAYAYVGKFMAARGRIWDTNASGTAYFIRCVAKAKK